MSETRGKLKQTGRLKDKSPRRAPSSSKKGSDKEDKGGGKEDKGKYKAKYFCQGGKDKVCKKEIKHDDDCICCDTCGKWFHNLCQLKSVEEFEAIQKYEFFWVCSFCQDLMPSLLKHAELKKQVAESLSEFKGLLIDQGGSVAGAAASSKESCRVQVAAYNDLKRQLDEQASLIRDCRLSCEEQSRLINRCSDLHRDQSHPTW